MKKHTLLLVDDEELVLSGLERTFLKSPYQVLTASTGSQALALLESQSVSLILSDNKMPGMSGIELFSQVRRRWPDCARVLLTGFADTEAAIAAINEGWVHRFLTKPCDAEQLLQTAEEMVAYVDLICENRRLSELTAQQNEELRQLNAELDRRVMERTAQLTQMNATVNKLFEDLYLNYRATLRALASALEVRDVETQGHAQRVVLYCLQLGEQLNLSDREMIALEHGALLHDIGKIGIPDTILHKPGPLSPEEWDVMRRHIDRGAEILRGVAFLEDAVPVVTQHHEKWDGSGYPLGLKGEQISLNARIFALADALDAITSDRPYRAGASFEFAAEELKRCAGTHFDPRVVDAFLTVPLDEWQQLCESVSTAGSDLLSSRCRSIRPLILSKKKGRPGLQA